MRIDFLKHIPKTLLVLWGFIIIVTISILIFIPINRRIIALRVIFTEMEFVAQMTFSEYKQNRNDNLSIGEEKDIGSINNPLYKNYKRSIKISKSPTQPNSFRLELKISKNGYKRIFTEHIQRKE